MDELENIDDELDETGIIFVTTEDQGLAKKHGIKSFPSLILFRNKEPVQYKGIWCYGMLIIIIKIIVRLQKTKLYILASQWP